MTSGTYKLLFEVPNDKEFPISNNDNSSTKKKTKQTAGLKCAQPAGILIVVGENLQQFNLNNTECSFLWTWFLTPLFRSLVSFINVLYISIYKFCSHFVMCIPKYFKNFDATLSGTYFFFCLFLIVHLVLRDEIDLCILTFYPMVMPNIFISFSSFL